MILSRVYRGGKGEGWINKERWRMGRRERERGRKGERAMKY